MSRSSPDFSDLIARHALLVRELVDVNKKLQRVAAAAAGRGSKAHGAASKPAASAKAAGGKKRRAWFERGEALELMLSIAKKPMRQADLVRALGARKGYDKSLSAAAQKQFAGAAYQAVANAISGGKLVSAKDGSVRARAAA